MCLTEKKKLLGSNLRADNGAGSIANCHLQTRYTKTDKNSSVFSL